MNWRLLHNIQRSYAVLELNLNIFLNANTADD